MQSCWCAQRCLSTHPLATAARNSLLQPLPRLAALPAPPHCPRRRQVVLWDKIIERKEDARIKVRSLRQKYAFLDQGAGLRGRDLNLTLSWNVMPKVGRLVTRCKSFPAGPLPDAYTA